MVHTLPDYTSKWKTNTITAIADNAELAARLGSIVSYDRRGNVLWMDNFEGAVSKWQLTGAGVGNAQAINAAYSRMGEQSLKLTSGSTLTRQARARMYIPYRVDGKMGFEFAWTRGLNMEYLTFYLYFYTGAKYVYSGLRFVNGTSTLEYLDDGAAWQTIEAGLSVMADNRAFNIMKLVVDTDTNYYVRALFNENEWDLSAYPCDTAASAVAATIRPDIQVFSTAAANTTVFADCAICTINEV